MLFSDISAQLLAMPMEDFFSASFRDLDPQMLEVEALSYACDCSRERMEKVLLSLGPQELSEMIDQDGGAEIVCNFCRTRHNFSKEELQSLLVRAQEVQAQHKAD